MRWALTQTTLRKSVKAFHMVWLPSVGEYLQGSVRGSREHSEGPSLDDSHFPAALGGSSLLGGSSGAPRYAVAAGASGNTIRPEDFPALAGEDKYPSRHVFMLPSSECLRGQELLHGHLVALFLPFLGL